MRWTMYTVIRKIRDMQLIKWQEEIFSFMDLLIFNNIMKCGL